MAIQRKCFYLIIYHIAYLIIDYIFFVNENSRSIFLVVENIKILSKIVQLFKIFNDYKDKELNVSISIDDKLCNKIIARIAASQSQTDLNKEKEFYKEIDIVNNESQELIFNTDDKLNTMKIFKLLWRTTSCSKHISSKSFMSEYFNFIEILIQQNIVKYRIK